MEAEAAAVAGGDGGGSGDDGSCGWSWEENKMFEVALATVVEGGNPERYWERVAAMIGGGSRKKSAEEVRRHYEDLVEDLRSIESGRLDHELFDAPALDEDDGDVVAAAAAGGSASCWTEGDQELLGRLAMH